jgi:glycerophosphoryl diester phosphodiesterase
MNAWRYPRLIAHRGGGALAPENTLAAMRVGAAQGYRMVEFDAKLTHDGIVILMHDDTLERTTNGQGPVAESDWPSISELDAGSTYGKAFAGEPVPRLIHVARFLIVNDLACNIEIKPCPGRERETGERVAREAQRLWAGRELPALLSSFSEEALAAAARIAPEFPRGLLFEDLPTDALARAQALGCSAIHYNHRHADRTSIDAAHAAGLRCLFYTVNEASRVGELLEWGADGFFTDALDRIAPVG